MSMNDTIRFKKIYIEITNLCNLRCDFCSGNFRPYGVMTTKSFEVVLKKIRPYTDYIYLHVLGEPLTHPDIFAMLNIAGSQRVMVNLTTNGLNLQRLTGQPEAFAPIRQINLSLHCQGGTADWDKQQVYLQDVLRNARWVLSNTHTIISLRLWNLAVNDPETEKYNALALQKIQDTFNLEAMCLLPSGQKQGEKLQDRLYLNLDERFEWPEKATGGSSARRAFCYGLRDHLAILVDGSVVPCCLDANGSMILGNVMHENLETILSRERSQRIIQGFSEGRAVEALCKRCTYRERF